MTIKKIKITTTFLSVLIIFLVTGCVVSVPEPFCLKNEPHRKYIGKEKVKYDWYSKDSAKSGWSYLEAYFNKNSWIPAINESYIGNAMKCFNYAGNFNYQNYQAYWGVGVTRGVQATMTDDKKNVEKYLKQSIEFMLMARALYIVEQKTINLDLDLANAYTGLGAFYLYQNNKNDAMNNLQKSEIILRDIIKQKKENGRTYYLLAATLFYQKRYDEAKEITKKAKGIGYKMPIAFLNSINDAVSQKQLKTLNSK